MHAAHGGLSGGGDDHHHPLKTFPLIKDLVTDMSWNYEQAKSLPALQLSPPDADGNRRMAQIDVDRVQEFHTCIECFMCQDVCHVIRDHPENMGSFVGPRYCVLLAAIGMHPLDQNDKRATAITHTRLTTATSYG